MCTWRMPLNYVNGTEIANNVKEGGLNAVLDGSNFWAIFRLVLRINCGLYLLIGRVTFPETFRKWIADDFQLCHLQVEN